MDLFFVVVVSVCLHFSSSFGWSLNRDLYNNYRASERHDGFMSFGSKSFSFPLSLKWSRSDLKCTFLEQSFTTAVDEQNLYCVSNDLDDLERNRNSSLLAIDINNGNINWEAAIYTKSDNITRNLTSWDGIVVSGGYIGVLDDNYGNLFLLNATNGNITDKYPLHDGCPDNLPNGEFCIYSGMTSSLINNIPYFYTYYSSSGTLRYNSSILLATDAKNNEQQVITVENQESIFSQDPTICNNGKILGITNLFDSVKGYSIDPNNGTLTLLWTYDFETNFGASIGDALVCIPPSDSNGKFQFLAVSVVERLNRELWILLDSETGELINQFDWQETSLAIPAIQPQKNILIRNSELGRVVALDLSSSNNGTWKELWVVQNAVGSYYTDVLIIDNNLLLSNGTAMDVLSISDGSKLWTYSFPNTAFYSTLSAGLDSNGKPMIFIIGIEETDPKIKSTVYALQ